MLVPRFGAVLESFRPGDGKYNRTFYATFRLNASEKGRYNLIQKPQEETDEENKVILSLSRDFAAFHQNYVAPPIDTKAQLDQVVKLIEATEMPEDQRNLTQQALASHALRRGLLYEGRVHYLSSWKKLSDPYFPRPIKEDLGRSRLVAIFRFLRPFLSNY